MAKTKHTVRRRPGTASAGAGRPAARRASAGAPARRAGWIAGARPRTLPLAVAPVALGTGAAWATRVAGPYWLAILALAVSLLLQIGVNYANDYSDGVRGTDAYRVGPPRLTGSGAAKPRTVLIVALCCFALAGIAGAVIVVVSQHWWLFAVGAAGIAAAWFYTGGRRPYGYAGLGEVAVFLFFGLAATAGTTYVLIGTVNAESWLCAVAIGSIACAVLVVNNLRDIDQDRAAGKHTLSARIGARGSRILFAALMLVPYLVLGWLALFYPTASLVFLTLLIAAPATLIAITGRRPRDLVIALSLTGITALLYGLGVAAALAF